MRKESLTPAHRLSRRSLSQLALESIPEEQLAGIIRMLRLPPPQRQYAFLPERRYRADFAWPEQRLIVEVEGGTFVQGRHVRGQGFAADCERQNLAVLAGWRYLRVTPQHIDGGQAIAWIEQALGRAA